MTTSTSSAPSPWTSTVNWPSSTPMDTAHSATPQPPHPPSTEHHRPRHKGPIQAPPGGMVGGLTIRQRATHCPWEADTDPRQDRFVVVVFVLLTTGTPTGEPPRPVAPRRHRRARTPTKAGCTAEPRHPDGSQR